MNIQKIITFLLVISWQTALFASLDTDVETSTEEAIVPECETLLLEEAVSDTAAVVYDGAIQMSHGKFGPFPPSREFSISTAPLLTFGFVAKAHKKYFRSARNNFIPSYKNQIDNWTQYAPFAVATVLNVSGYEGRSRIDRYLVSSAMSYAFMASFVNGIKYSAKEMRPDGSTANSFPSGHTATAFTAATILHKEYGLTRSPWWSVGGYACATLTGVMRSLNNRHWISDILVGAGIGVLSADLGYMVTDYIYKNKGLKRANREGNADLLEQRSFFNFSLGAQMNSGIKLPTNIRYSTQARLWDKNNGAILTDDYYEVVREGNPFNISDDMSVAHGKETYNHYANKAGRNNSSADAFWNHPSIKVGTGTTVSAEAVYFPVRYAGFGLRLRVNASPVYADGLTAYDMDGKGNLIPLANSASATDIWSIVDWGTGFHFAYPFNSYHRLSAKVMYGCRYFGTLDLSGVNDMSLAPYGGDGTVTLYGDNLYVDNSKSNSIGCGLQYTFAMTNGMAVSTYFDYDYCKPEFAVEYQPYNTNMSDMLTTRSTFSFRQKVMSYSFGASMTVLF